MKKEEKYRKEIEKKQNLALLIEATEVLAAPSVNSKFNGNYFSLDEREGYRIDITQSVFKRLINETMYQLINQNFIIDLNDTKIPGFREEKLGKYRELDSLYEQMTASFYYISKCKRTDKINFIEMLLEKKQYDIITELILSKKLTMDQKFEIVDTIIRNYQNDMEEIFTTIPQSYYDITKGKSDNQEEFKQILSQALQQIYNKKENYIRGQIRSNIRKDCRDCTSLRGVSNVVRFFMEYNLIDINEVKWNYEEKEITTAAATYIIGKTDIAQYLYSLKEYMDNDELLKDTSDIAVLEYIIEYCPWNLKDFITLQNYTNTKEKFFSIIDMLDEKNDKEDNSYTIDRESIINILLRKTKKEDYKKIKIELIVRKENEKLLKENEKLLDEKRQELTSTLVTLNNYLLETKPAKAKIKDLHLGKQTIQ